DEIVAVSQVADMHGYNSAVTGFYSPELPSDASATTALVALRQLFLIWGLDPAGQGTNRWNPLADLIPVGSSVVVKPNWVYHAARGPASFDSLVTHTSAIQAVLEYVALARPAKIIIGDAPLQSCDFAMMRDAADL